LRLHHGDAGVAHEALELVLLPRVNPRAKHSNDREQPPSGIIELSSLQAAPSCLEGDARVRNPSALVGGA
jgi:hypothetical protein